MQPPIETAMVTAAAGAVMVVSSHRQRLRIPGGYFLVGLAA
jgi:hypothetical protein